MVVAVSIKFSVTVGESLEEETLEPREKDQGKREGGIKLARGNKTAMTWSVSEKDTCCGD